MRKKALFASLAVAVTLLAIAGFAAAGGGQSSLADVRNATAKYHDIEVARALHDEVELAQVQPYGEGRASPTSKGPVRWGSTCCCRTASTGCSSRTSPRRSCTSSGATGATSSPASSTSSQAARNRRSMGRRSPRRTSPASATGRDRVDAPRMDLEAERGRRLQALEPARELRVARGDGRPDPSSSLRGPCGPSGQRPSRLYTSFWSRHLR